VTHVGKLQGCILVFTKGVAAGQQKVILDNTEDTLILDGTGPSRQERRRVHGHHPNGTVAPSILVKIYDNDAPAVMVIESDGITEVIEGSTFILETGSPPTHCRSR